MVSPTMSTPTSSTEMDKPTARLVVEKSFLAIEVIDGDLFTVFTVFIIVLSFKFEMGPIPEVGGVPGLR